MVPSPASRTSNAYTKLTTLLISGDLSDFQPIQSLLDKVIIYEFTQGDGHGLGT